MYRADATVKISSEDLFGFNLIGGVPIPIIINPSGIGNISGVEFELEGLVASGRVTVKVIGTGTNVVLNGVSVHFFRLTSVGGQTVSHSESSTGSKASQLMYDRPSGLFFMRPATEYGRAVGENVDDFVGEVYTQTFTYTEGGTTHTFEVVIMYELRSP